MSGNRASTLYGKGVFTTVAVFDTVPLFWKKHWRRLNVNGKIVGIDLSDYTAEQVIRSILKELSETGIVNGRVRVTFLDESPSPIWRGGSNNSTAHSIITDGVRPIPDNFKLTVSPYPINSRSPLAGVKSCNYLEQIMSLDEAKVRGFHEALRVNEKGFITSACMANIFWLKGGELFTPALTTGCLAGTTREFVLENLQCSEVEAGIEELDSAEAIYLTSAGLGIVAVAEFASKKLSKAKHPILELLT